MSAAVQVPTAPGAAQVTHAPEQSVAQQTPSEQKPDAHALPSEQGRPAASSESLWASRFGRRIAASVGAPGLPTAAPGQARRQQQGRGGRRSRSPRVRARPIARPTRASSS